MRIVSIVGARPQFVKLAPVSRAMASGEVTGGTSIEDIIVHTGQHYDAGMSDVFFDELEIPKPAIHLGVGSGSHGAQTARMLETIETALQEQRPDWVVIYGDTNSTLAGAVAAAKLHIPIAHIEAGLRSFDRHMPEEVNRLVADHTSDLLFAPTDTAMDNLRNENLIARAVKCGDVMLDAVEFNAILAEQRSDILSTLGLEEGGYAVATVHRPVNTDGDKLLKILGAFNQIAADGLPVVFPAHPRTIGLLEKHHSGWQAHEGLRMIDPVGYLDMLKLLKHARLALTDSGGLQKEALFVNTACITLRDETEWPETVFAGGNVLTGADPDKMLAAVAGELAGKGAEASGTASDMPFGDGNAAAAIVRRLVA